VRLRQLGLESRFKPRQFLHRLDSFLLSVGTLPSVLPFRVPSLGLSPFDLGLEVRIEVVGNLLLHFFAQPLSRHFCKHFGLANALVQF